MGESCTDMMVTTEAEDRVTLRLSELMPPANSCMIRITHPATTALTRTDVVMIITQTTEDIVITEKEIGVTTGATGAEATMTIQDIANTQSTGATGIPTHTKIVEVIKIVVGTKIMAGTEIMVGTVTMVAENIVGIGTMGTESMADTELSMVGTEQGVVGTELSVVGTESMGSTMSKYNPQAERPLEHRTGPTRAV